MTKWGDVAELATEEPEPHRGCDTAHAQMHCRPETYYNKSKVRRGFNRRKGHHLMNGKTEVFQTEMALVSV